MQLSINAAIGLRLPDSDPVMQAEVGYWMPSRNGWGFQSVMSSGDEQKSVGVVYFSQVDNARTELIYIHVLPSFQGRGIGKELMHAAARTLQEKNGNQVVAITVRSVFPNAMDDKSPRFYARMGFVAPRILMGEVHLISTTEDIMKAPVPDYAVSEFTHEMLFQMNGHIRDGNIDANQHVAYARQVHERKEDIRPLSIQTLTSVTAPELDTVPALMHILHRLTDDAWSVSADSELLRSRLRANIVMYGYFMPKNRYLALPPLLKEQATYALLESLPLWWRATMVTPKVAFKMLCAQGHVLPPARIRELLSVQSDTERALRELMSTPLALEIASEVPELIQPLFCTSDGELTRSLVGLLVGGKKAPDWMWVEVLRSSAKFIEPPTRDAVLVQAIQEVSNLETLWRERPVLIEEFIVIFLRTGKEKDYHNVFSPEMAVELRSNALRDKDGKLYKAFKNNVARRTAGGHRYFTGTTALTSDVLDFADIQTIHMYIISGRLAGFTPAQAQRVVDLKAEGLYDAVADGIDSSVPIEPTEVLIMEMLKRWYDGELEEDSALRFQNFLKYHFDHLTLALRANILNNIGEDDVIDDTVADFWRETANSQNDLDPDERVSVQVLEQIRKASKRYPNSMLREAVEQLPITLYLS
jgi:GNAT superfamily N-acetyltransferase